MELSEQPINNIVWMHVNELQSNDYNPNVCAGLENKLLSTSLLTNGWIQPILATPNKIIIDGFHRWTQCRTNHEVYAMTEGKVPVAILDISEAERKMLTVRINRAKGVHVAFKMHELVTSLVHEEGIAIPDVAKGIGATREEVQTLLTENVFIKKNVANTAYSKSWAPKQAAK
jgi:ParB-like chromosome segregation protein Spo0J